MMLPAVILLIVFSYVPLFGLTIAFRKFNPGLGIFGSPWVGWDNFRFLFTLPETPRVMFNTIYIALMKIVTGLVFPIFVALLLNEVRRSWLKRGVQTLIYLPYFLSWVVLGGIFLEILSRNGLINQFLGLFGIDSILFLGRNDVFPHVVWATDLWRGFGYSTILYLAAITNINPNLYEAAMVDGAGHMRQVWHITLPGMIPIIVLLTTLSLGNVLNAGFEQLLVLTNNGENTLIMRSGEVIDTFVYRLGFTRANNFSVATAMGLFKSVVSLILVSSSYYLAFRTVKYRIF